MRAFSCGRGENARGKCTCSDAVSCWGRIDTARNQCISELSLMKLSLSVMLCLGLFRAGSLSTQAAPGKPPTRLPTDPGTPALIAAGPAAEALARAALTNGNPGDPANNPTSATPGANP